jgi:hypothetical protein
VAVFDDPDGSGHKVLAINDEEAAVLRRVADLIVAHHHSVYSIAPLLNTEGVRTRRGRMWRHTNLCWQLRQPRLTGSWTYHKDGDPIKVKIPAIFEQAKFDLLQACIKGTPRPQPKAQIYALTGRGDHKHSHCSCGGGYYGKKDTSKKGRTYYR